MSYFADLTPHTYTSTDDKPVVNIGWLSAAHPFPTGESSVEFRDALRRLCEHPIYLYRGFHQCEFCSDPVLGNGQIRIKGHDDVWFAAPVLIHHYVVEHSYLPPPQFIAAIVKAGRAMRDRESDL